MIWSRVQNPFSKGPTIGSKSKNINDTSTIFVSIEHHDKK